MSEIWLIDTDINAQQAALLMEFIDPEEIDRAARIPGGARRNRYLAAHAAARRLTAAAAGAPPERIRWRRGPHGRPEPVGLAGELSVNLSTSGPWALFAVQHRAGGDGEIGVDLEPVPTDHAAARLARRYYPPSETGGGAAEFTSRWTRKEAYTKAYGGRLADGLRTHVGPVGAPGGHGGSFRVDGPLGPCTVHDLPAPPGFRAAVARTGVRPLRPTLLTHPADWNDEFDANRTSAICRPDRESRP
ncbi:4'-phosphopantetheinyl transferase family protein [Kitasatospora sp. NPDC092948]|uniref:4'-phosphopantetheinyl transferase family protein n=1 Tax=Kitasatospora sp. NPDC092948 TaxID=3364088 RepID=UPI00380C3ABD